MDIRIYPFFVSFCFIGVNHRSPVRPSVVIYKTVTEAVAAAAARAVEDLAKWAAIYF
jgi:hypothetical protein